MMGGMALPPSPEHRRRRQIAFEHAARVHAESAVLHEAAAAVFERSGNLATAQRERLLASKEMAAAELDRGRAAEQ
jgi:hypothetical protein